MAFIGWLLRGVQAGDKHLAWNHPALSTAPATLVLKSSAFEHGRPMPQQHAGAGVGDNISPPLAWTNAPEGTAELVLFCEDTGAPTPRPIVHLIATGISPTKSSFFAGALNPTVKGAAPTTDCAFGRCSFGMGLGYSGPRPIPSHGPHSYVFQLFALSQPLSFDRPPDKAQVLAQMQGAVLARGRLDGTYER